MEIFALPRMPVLVTNARHQVASESVCEKEGGGEMYIYISQMIILAGYHIEQNMNTLS